METQSFFQQKSNAQILFVCFGLFFCFEILNLNKHKLGYFGPQIAAGEKSVLFIRVEHFPSGYSSGENDPWSSDDPWSSWKKSKWPEEQQNQTTLGHTRSTGIYPFGTACCRASDEQNEPCWISMSLYMFHGKLVQPTTTKAIYFEMLQREFGQLQFIQDFLRQSPGAYQRLLLLNSSATGTLCTCMEDLNTHMFCYMNRSRYCLEGKCSPALG